MTRIKPRVLLFRLLLLAVLCVLMDFGFNIYRSMHTVFDSQKWKTDVASRFDMPEPVCAGMRKSEVLKLLGKPDSEASPDANGKSVFVYRIPYGWPGEVKAVRFVNFENDVVVSLGFDDSGEEFYPGDPAYRPDEPGESEARNRSK